MQRTAGGAPVGAALTFAMLRVHEFISSIAPGLDILHRFTVCRRPVCLVGRAFTCVISSMAPSRNRSTLHWVASMQPSDLASSRERRSTASLWASQSAASLRFPRYPLRNCPCLPPMSMRLVGRPPWHASMLAPRRLCRVQMPRGTRVRSGRWRVQPSWSASCTRGRPPK